MTSSSDPKTCSTCCMEIPTGAKKCPYCQHYQNRRAVIMHHPVPVILVVFVLYGVFVGVMATLFPDHGEDIRNYANDITVVSSEMRFGEGYDGPTVAVIGRMRNESDVNWKEVRFHVEFRDADGTLVDVHQEREREYFYYLPVHEEAGFKVSFLREFPESSYASHSVRVITAKDGRNRF